MRKLRIYLDTSVVNFLFATDAPDFRQVTTDFFENYADDYDLFVSEVVLLEISRTKNPDQRQRLENTLQEYPITLLPDDETDEIQRLAFRYIEESVIPRAKLEDALHVAYATIHEMDILLSWNFKHLANLRREAKILAVNQLEGFRYPLRLTSPLEVLDERE